MKGELLVTAGILIIIVGIFLTFIGTAIKATSQPREKETQVKTAGVVLIGPIPIIFGSDRKMLITGVALALILMIVAYILFYR